LERDSRDRSFLAFVAPFKEGPKVMTDLPVRSTTNKPVAEYYGDLSTAASIYEGRAHVGWVLPKGERFEAITAKRRSLGLFNSSNAAQIAAWANYSDAGSCK
jgi:hypothetical protein